MEEQFIEDFGQKIDLTQRIREVLLNYPEGTTILKELIQNADDAGATKVCFCIDGRQHGVESLISIKLKDWQGPSLLSYNDAQFTEEDFESISRIGDSRKQGQAWKTGRFGVGFNSVYHLSDLPSFVSGKYVVLFDPHCKYLPRISSTNPGKRIDFVTSLALQTYGDQFSPYRAFGCDMERPFNGTLFRFPLRSVEQASVSRLSKQVYTTKDMEQLLRDFYDEAVLAMLFLKNVEVIEFYTWGNGEGFPTQLSSCSVGSLTPEIRKHRQVFSRLSKNPTHREEEDAYRIDLRSKVHHGDDKGKEVIRSFLISQRMASPSSRIGTLAKVAIKDYGLNLVPWASVAAEISEMPLEESGRAFCFLPLPLKTGLPVHVNGYFEISANRRDIWFGTDMDRMGKLRSSWNECLLEDVAGPSLALLILKARIFGPGPIYYSLWPRAVPADPWSRVVKRFYQAVATTPFLYSAVGNGGWISASEAFFHDEEYPDSDGLAVALIAEGVPVVRLPKPVTGMILQYSVAVGQAKMVIPSFVRALLRKQVVHNCLVDRVHTCTLLDYCLSDLLDEEAGQDLKGLPLVHLKNHKLGVFGPRQDTNSYFLCTGDESRLLESVPGRLVDQNISEQVLERLGRIAAMGQINIRLLDDTGLVQILHLVLPPEWKNRDRVDWKPAVEKRHPTEEWLTLFWSYLARSRTDLSKLNEWPLLPTLCGVLRRPVSNSGLLRSGKMTSSLEAVFMKLGCDFLDTKVRLEHPELLKYVPDPSATAILDALALNESTLATRFVEVCDSERQELRRYLYDACWSSRKEMNQVQLRIFKTLPIFEVYGGHPTSDAAPRHLMFTSLLGGNKFLAPKGVDEELLGPEFVSLETTSMSSKEAEVLIQLLDVVHMRRVDFFKQKVIGRVASIPVETRDSTVLQFLRELPQLSLEDRFLVQTLKQVAFLPTGDDGTLKAPENVYDPDNLELVKLLADKNFFPSAEYSSQETLQALRSLGLRTVVSPDTLIFSARLVQSLISDPAKAAERGRVLLSYLDTNSNKWLPSQEAGIGWILSKAMLQGERESALKKFWSELSTISWCPVLVEAPHSNMPWPTTTQSIVPPKLVRLQSDMWLASATMRILDGQCHSPGLRDQLGWSTKLRGNVLAAQLLELARNDDAADQLGKVLATMIPKIYSLLSEMLGTEEMEIVKAVLEGSKWIWVGSGFAKAEEVVFDGPLHLAPYLHVVPLDLAAFRDLFVELGVKESLSPAGYNSILSTMFTEKQGEPLESRQLAAVIWIVQHLADVRFSQRGMETYIPDINAVLVPSSQLVYNDAPWLAASRTSEKNGFKYVHAKISNDVADNVGVSSVRRSLLADSADLMELGLHSGMEAFGQSEALTSRLKHIVEMYADGPGILFELLQNADDAGAREVCLVLDRTQHGTSSVLSKQMGDWQGPALYCYNDSVFKPEDFRAISRIGQDAKLEKPSAIGRFGLGFNSVYHFTDVPSFVSGETIVVLDPHASNLPGITAAQPGLKINFVGRGLLKQFPDQFEPFVLLGCDMEKPFDGTLFRFPLRTEATAPRSEIKKEVYSPDDVAALLSSLEKSGPEVLLFLRNIKTLKVYVRHGLHEMEETYQVAKQRDDYDENQLCEFVRGTGHDKQVQFLKRLEKTPGKQLPSACGKISLTISRPGNKECSSWLLSSALGGGNAKTFAVAPANRSRGFVPWSGVAAKLAAGDKVPSNFEGRAFCFLPLPVKLDLPVHVNGYFELSANRRDIWYGADMVGGGKLKSEWNMHMLEDATALAYAHLLQQAARELGPCPEFHSLWPVSNTPEPWAFLVKQLYKVVVDLELPVFYTAARGGKWISPKFAVFPDSSFSEMSELGSALVELGLPIIGIPSDVISMFQQLHQSSLKFLSPQFLRRLLVASRKTFEKRVSVLALKYCLRDIEGAESGDKLQGLSLVPLANGLFGTFGSRQAGEKIILANSDEFQILRDRIPHLLVDPNEVGDKIFATLSRLASEQVGNLFLLTPQLLAELLPNIFPLEWGGEDLVSWIPGQNGHPTVEWMELFWKNLRTSCEDLSPFENWPLLPTTTDKLLKLVRNAPVLQNEAWSEHLMSLFQNSGCFLLRKDFSVNYPALSAYVHEASAQGVLSAMLSAVGGNHKMLPMVLRNCSAAEVRELRSYLLQTKWFTSGLDAVQLKALKMLRLFESGAEFRCVAESNYFIAPDGIDLQLLGGRFIHAEAGKEEQILTTYVGLKKISKEDYFAEHFVDCFEQVPPEQRPQAFLKIVQDVPLLANIATTLCGLPFVSTALGTVEAPAKLYDPRVPELLTLLDKDAYFPAKDFVKEDILDVLVFLGLKRTIERDGILDAARSVAMMSTSDELGAHRRGKALMAHIDSLVNNSKFEEQQVFDTDFWAELLKISWCPVCLSSPNAVLPWLSGENSHVAPPKLVRHSSDLWLVSGSMRVLDGDCSPVIRDKLGWNKRPNVGVLASQLAELSNRYTKMRKNNDLELGESVTGTISKEIISMYSRLQEFMGTREMLVLQSLLEGRAWLWIGAEFCTAHGVAFDAPAHFQPYLQVVPSELMEFRELLEALGVRDTFGVTDYVNALRGVATDAKGDALDSEKLSFVLRLLEAAAEVLPPKTSSIYESILLPDATSHLMPASGLVYNDAPWLATDSGVIGMLRMVHPDVDNELAKQLGARSLRYMSAVDQEVTSSLPCMGMSKISELLAMSGGDDLLLFDLMEIADCCNASKVHFIYDTRDHPKQSLLQPNLSGFQGPALLVAFEDVSLTTEEICALHASPSLKLRGNSCMYGGGLLGGYRLTSLLSIVSSGYLYLFDPAGQILADGKKAPLGNPVGKAFSLQGTGLPNRFSDQFHCFEISDSLSWSSSNVTIFRLPLNDDSSVINLFQRFKQYASSSLLFLRSLQSVILSQWNDDQPLHEEFSVSISSSSANLRHPFQEAKWRKFQLSSFFGNSNGRTKLQTIDVNIKDQGEEMLAKWLILQTLASGCTRDMALDRRYLQHQLTPVGGVAACISTKGAVDKYANSCILSPLPVPLEFQLPVTLFGHFLPFHRSSRQLFNKTLGDFLVKVGVLGIGPPLSDEIIRGTWNRHLLSCVGDSYIELIQEVRPPSYSLWPKSRHPSSTSQEAQCLVNWLIKPMYTRLVELPVWQLHGGSLVKFSEGLFVAPPGEGVEPKTSVSDFLRAHYRVFTVPWEIGKEAEETGVPMKELTPKALRALMKVPSVAAAVHSLTTQIDLFEYCCADVIQTSSEEGASSSTQNLELKPTALSELKGVTCPTANEFMVKLGTLEVWIASSEQQQLLPGLLKRFLHPLSLERPLLASLVYNSTFQSHLNLKSFSSHILAANMWTVFPKEWAEPSRPWIHWKEEPTSAGWLRNFWKHIDATKVEEVQLFASWPLVPASRGTSKLLVRVGQRNIVFVTRDGEADEQWLVPLLSKFNIPVFDSTYGDALTCFPDEGQSLVHTVVSKLLALRETGFLQLAGLGLTDTECDNLFKFFVTGTSSGTNLTMDELAFLRSLPIYKTIRGEYVAIEQRVQYMVQPEGVFRPDDEHRLPYPSAPEGRAFYDLLGVQQLRDTEVLVRHCLPNFSLVDENEQATILGHIFKNWDTWKLDTALVERLKDTEFVSSGVSSGSLFRPGQLLDPENEILKQVFAEERAKFPGGRFTNSRWLQILRATGLRSIKEPALILECARKIEELGKQDINSQDLSLLRNDSAGGSRHISDAVWSMGGMLVEEILKNLASVYGSNFCEPLSKISFVPAEKGIPTLAGGSPSRVFTSYSEAILVKDWPLAWTCCPLLTRSNMVPPDFAWNSLHMRSPPLVPVVMKHLQVVGKNGGEDVLARWPNTKGSRTVEDVFGDVLEYLSKAWDGISDSDKKQLCTHAFVPVGNGTRLVPASSLYTRLGVDLAPFIYEVPRAYLSHVDILSALGMRYEPTVASMKELLHHLQQTCGYQHLNPNELHAVLCILRFIVDDARSTSTQLSVENAVVPDEYSRLVSAGSCAYIDTAGARLIGEIDSTRVRLVHPSVGEELCTVLRVKKLSAIVIEEIDDTTPLEYVDSFQGLTVALVKERLSNNAFQESLWTLVCGFKGVSTSTEVTKQLMLEKILFVAENIRFVTHLYTKLTLLPTGKDITRYPTSNSSEARRHRFFYHLNRRKAVVVVAEPPKYISAADVLAVVISQVLGFPVCLPIGPLFQGGENVDGVLRLVSSGKDASQKQGATAINLGSPVHPVDSKMLQLCPLRPFYSGEIVAWYNGQKSDLRYGRVTEDIRAPAGRPLYHIRVETNPGEVQVLLSSNILSFKSTGSNNNNNNNNNVSSPLKVSSPLLTTGSTSSSSSDEVPEAEAQSESGGDYAQAISDVLISLGLPLSLERRSLLEHTLSLQEQLNSTSTLLRSEQMRADCAVKEAETVKTAWTCRICLSIEVDTMLVPCGHIMCKTCSSAVARCPFCRKNVTNTHCMYRP